MDNTHHSTFTDAYEDGAQCKKRLYKARADEREEIAQTIEARYDYMKRESAHANDIQYWDGFLDGLDAAISLVRGAK